MARPFRSRYDAVCADESCGAFLPAGSLIRWYRNGKVYGVHCHTKSESVQAKNGIYREKKQKEFNTPCGHEDYPCCGCYAMVGGELVEM